MVSQLVAMFLLFWLLGLALAIVLLHGKAYVRWWNRSILRLLRRCRRKVWQLTKAAIAWLIRWLYVRLRRCELPQFW